ncbi:MAG TPA: hypothetical protein VKY19_25930 [Ktedonosporobacter sp.]|jgi:hypothetical protein|nr:hypothetical protein [Ktedonosporobacter sp.]
MTQNSSNVPKQPTLKLARLISFVGLLLLFLVANQPFNLAATLVFVVSLVGCGLVSANCSVGGQTRYLAL